jgi:hypothetical protein
MEKTKRRSTHGHLPAMPPDVPAGNRPTPDSPSNPITRHAVDMTAGDPPPFSRSVDRQTLLGTRYAPATGNTPSARVRNWVLQKTADWDEDAKQLWTLRRDTTEQLLQGQGQVQLDRLKRLWPLADRLCDLQRLEKVEASATALIDALAPDTSQAANRLRTECQVLLRRCRQSLCKACLVHMKDWLALAPRPALVGSSLPWKALSVLAEPAALSTQHSRWQAWVLFLRWLELELADPQGPSWKQVKPLMKQVALALGAEPDGSTRKRLRKLVDARAQAPKRHSKKTAWFTIEYRRDATDGHTSCKLARSCEAPATEEQHHSAQNEIFYWMLQELDDPEGVPWSALMRTVDALTKSWKWPLDRGQLLGLCLHEVQRMDMPNTQALRELLHWLQAEGMDDGTLRAVLAHASDDRLNPVIRALLLEAAVSALCAREAQSHSLLYAEVLQAVFAQENPNERAALLARIRQHAPWGRNSITESLLDAILRLDRPDAPSGQYLLDMLGCIERRERHADRDLWLALCQPLLKRVAPQLFTLAHAMDTPQARQAGKLMLQLLWRLSHPRTGEQQQQERAVKDQADLLRRAVNAFLPAQRAAVLDWLGELYVQQLKKAQLRADQDVPAPSFVAAQAMYRAIGELKASGPQVALQ